MKTRGRFLLLFALLALLTALASAVFAYRAIGGAEARAEEEYGPGPGLSARALDRSLPEAERLGAALADAQALRARAAALRLGRAQAALEAAVSIGVFSLLWAGVAALLFGLGSRALTRRLDLLAEGAREARRHRDFRFRPSADREFGPVFATFNETFDRLAEQEERLAEAARLDGWREVSSFLFHQLKTPLSSIELGLRNLELGAAAALAQASAEAAEGPPHEGKGGVAASVPVALEELRGRAASAAEECLRIRILLERFRSLAGLSLAPFEGLCPSELVAALRSRFPSDRARVLLEGSDEGFPADRRMVEEAFLNLLVNAAEACPLPPALLRIETGREPGLLVFRVSDGNGAVDPRLFEFAGKGRHSTKAEGTGLGLLFVRRVLALHGGSFSCFPGEDGGFCLRLAFPLERKEEG